MISVLLHVQMQQESSGDWTARLEAFPGCNTVGPTKENALQMLQWKAKEYFRWLMESGTGISLEKGVSVLDFPVIAVACDEPFSRLLTRWTYDRGQRGENDLSRSNQERG